MKFLARMTLAALVAATLVVLSRAQTPDPVVLILQSEANVAEIGTGTGPEFFVDYEIVLAIRLGDMNIAYVSEVLDGWFRADGPVGKKDK